MSTQPTPASTAIRIAIVVLGVAALVGLGVIIGLRFLPSGPATTGPDPSQTPATPTTAATPLTSPTTTPSSTTPSSASSTQDQVPAPVPRDSSAAGTSSAAAACTGLDQDLTADQCRLIMGGAAIFVKPHTCRSFPPDLELNGVVCDPADTAEVELADNSTVYLDEFTSIEHLNRGFRAFFENHKQPVPEELSTVAKAPARNTWNYVRSDEPAGDLGTLIDADRATHLQWTDREGLYSGELVTGSTPATALSWWEATG